MTVNLQEESTIVVPGIPVTMTASTAVTSVYVNTKNYESVECLLHLAVSAAGATSVGTIEILAASAAAGTGAEAVTFKDIYYTIGATTIAAGTGVPSLVEQSTAGVPTAKVSYATVAADGDKQQQYVIPIRSRHLPAGKPWVAVRFTAGSATARAGLVAFVLRGKTYGMVNAGTSVFA